MKNIIDNEVLKRVSREWEPIAKEPLVLDYIKGTIYGFGSEIAILRLAIKHTGNKNARHGYSENLKTWYFSLDVDFS